MKDCDRQQRSNTFAHTHLMLLLVVLMAAIRVGAQTSTTGDIAGLVTDPTAAVVSGAPITLKNVDTGSLTSTATNGQGLYNFSFLQPGKYSVSANAAGFQKVIKTVTVILGTSTTVNLQLSLSSQNESVEVTDEVTGVQTDRDPGDSEDPDPGDSEDHGRGDGEEPPPSAGTGRNGAAALAPGTAGPDRRPGPLKPKRRRASRRGPARARSAAAPGAAAAVPT